MRRRSRAIYITPSSRPWWPKQILQAMAGLAPARPPRATGRSWAGAHQVLGVQSVVVAPPRLDARRAAEEQGHHPAQELVRQRHQADEGGALGQRPGAGVEDGKTKGCLQRAAQLLRHCRAEGRRRALNMSTKCWDYGAGSAREAAGRVGTSKTGRQAHTSSDRRTGRTSVAGAVFWRIGHSSPHIGDAGMSGGTPLRSNVTPTAASFAAAPVLPTGGRRERLAAASVAPVNFDAAGGIDAFFSPATTPMSIPHQPRFGQGGGSMGGDIYRCGGLPQTRQFLNASPSAPTRQQPPLLPPPPDPRPSSQPCGSPPTFLAAPPRPLPAAPAPRWRSGSGSWRRCASTPSKRAPL